MPQLRIHFTDADIARTRLKLEVDLMWEVVSSVQVLQHTDGGAFFDAWRRDVRENASQNGQVRAAVQTVMAVAPHASYFPDFVTPTMDVFDLDASIDAVLSTSPARLRAELDRLQPVEGPVARWLADLGRGRSEALRYLDSAVRTYYHSLIVPHLHVIDDAVRTECAGGIRHYLRGGPEGLLRWLGPGTRWEPPVLVVDYAIDRDLYLDGRGLTLVPCYFCLYHPVALADPHLPPILVFPIQGDSRLLSGGRRGGDHLSALLGTTRAAILRSVLNGGTTTSLAKQVGVSPATISHHTSVLRDANLITTERHENCATHQITPLGLCLLTSDGVR